MTDQHPALNTISAGKLRLANRAAVAPMSRVSTHGDGVPTGAMTEYYRRFAAGGFGLVITEGTYTDREFAQAYPNQPGMTTETQEQAWRRIAEAIHAEGGTVFMQLMHGGALSQHLSGTRAASAIQPLRTMLAGYSRKQGLFPKPQAMNLAEIDAAIDGFVQAAQRAERAGFDGVEIHAANGYLLDQFLTDYTNLREDQYGGPVRNRIRLTAEVITAVTRAVGSDFVTGVRLSQGKVNDFDYLWGGGLADGEVIFSAVHEAGADYIHFASEGQGFDHGCLTREGDSLTKLARDVTGLPLIANGGLHNPSEARRILDEGHGDLVAIGTGALVNPDWPKKIAMGQRLLDFDPGMFGNGVDVESQFRWEASRDGDSHAMAA
ncbi:NADH:flavin oxidoreductase [Elongatibacter sediminis]|uniref:NADH:flavin oxidoreductase n=1 Tax=Elongatibacter sediminis TaxID=3119006 RepID=A0AAW9RBF9_9GAMM